jgi:DNA-binding transcriptional LysR family regulator
MVMAIVLKLTQQLSGRGIALIPDFIVADDLAAKRLIAILPDFNTPA